MMMKALISMASVLALVGLANASETNNRVGGATARPEMVRYDVIDYSPNGGKETWELAAVVGQPFTVGMDANLLSRCDFGNESVRSTLELSMPAAPGTTVQLMPVGTYPNGVLTLVDITKNSGAADRESTTLKWEADGKEHACVTNQGSYQVSRTISTMRLDYGKATRLKMPDGSVFQITASANWH